MTGRVFENDVKMYGIQTHYGESCRKLKFENDVKMYGIQTTRTNRMTSMQFENDVKMYGIQTAVDAIGTLWRLRMM